MTNSIGGFEQVMPDAQLSDGLFQLIVVKPSDPVSMMKFGSVGPLRHLTHTHRPPRQLEAVQLLQRPAGALRLCKLQWGGAVMGQLWGREWGSYGADVGQRYGAAPHLTQNGHSPTISRSRSAAIGRALGPEVGVAKRSPAPGSSSTSSSTSRGPAIGRRSSSTALSLDTSCGRGGLRAGGHAPLPTHPGVPP